MHLGDGLWAGGWCDDSDDADWDVRNDVHDRCDGQGVGGAVAGVYVPSVPGFNRVFTHVSDEIYANINLMMITVIKIVEILFGVVIVVAVVDVAVAIYVAADNQDNESSKTPNDMTNTCLHHLWPVPDGFSIIPRRLMTAVLEDVSR